MLDYWEGGGVDDQDIEILCPASPGWEAQKAPNWPEGCVFLTLDYLCELHDLGLKPIEGRVTSCKKSEGRLHEDVAMLWNTKKGRGVVRAWKKKFFNSVGCT